MKNWTRFASLASQWAVGILLSVWVGGWMDRKWRPTSNKPLFQWMIPFAFITGSLIQLIRETNKSKNEE